MRSILTTLGIIFGVCSVIAMLAIGEGASREAQKAIEQLGSTNLIIETVEPPDEQADDGQGNVVRNYGLTYFDAESIRNTIPSVEVVIPVRELNQEVRRFNRKAAVKIIGTVPWHTETSPISIVRGRFLSTTDLHNRLNVCVVDEKAAREIFIFDDPIGQTIKIQGTCWEVVGLVGTSRPTDSYKTLAKPVAAEQAASASTGNIYVPLTTARLRLTEFTATFSGGNLKTARIELQKIVVKVPSTEQVLPVYDALKALLYKFHNKKDYRIIIPLELLRQAAKTQQIFSIVLGSIAAISLLVGGIGIMNIMLATVSERTREIGIRRAMGANKKDIIIQFLLETLLLTLTGGCVGIMVGLIIPILVTRFSRMPTVVTGSSLILAFGISATVGIVFGLYPAYRAANMDPIESLRHE